MCLEGMPKTTELDRYPVSGFENHIFRTRRKGINLCIAILGDVSEVTPTPRYSCFNCAYIVLFFPDDTYTVKQLLLL